MRAAFSLLMVLSVGKAFGIFPPPTDFGPTNTFGLNLQRSMRLMNDSSPTNRETVRVLFYGQSITAQYWTVVVSDYLRARYTNANLIITNLAIGGFTSDILVKTAETDLYPFYPDLLIFQDYGPPTFYEQMIAQTRLRTTADILIQTDHPLVPGELTELIDPATLTPSDGEAWRNYSFLPDVAQRYGAELGDIRTPWKHYLVSNNYSPTNLLVDTIHPNAQGNYLMSELIEPYLRADYSFPADTWKDAVKTVRVGAEVNWNTNDLVLPFTGNRIDVFPAAQAKAAAFRIDGKKPSEFPELYSIGRASLYQNSVWPCVIGVTARTPLLEEDWTATVLDFQLCASGPCIRFSLSGSKTGFDGEGSSTNDFVSNSGRVVIDASDWMLDWGILQGGPLTPGFQIKWPVTFNGADELSSGNSQETRTVAQGLRKGPHVLTVERSSTESSPIRSIRVYNPAARTHPLSAAPTITTVSVRNETLDLGVSSTQRYILQSTENLTSAWQDITAPVTQTHLSLPLAGQDQDRFYRVQQVD